MIIYNRYLDGKDHTWYDSTNVIYSLCYDNNEATKTVKIVFKNGRTYVYRNVNVEDYIMFKNSDSQGKAVNTYIVKKYEGVRINDTVLDFINEYKDKLIAETNDISKTPFENLLYHMDMCQKDGKFQLKLNDKVIFTGIEGQVSIVNLFKSMNLNYTWNTVDEINEVSDENDGKLKFEGIND